MQACLNTQGMQNDLLSWFLGIFLINLHGKTWIAEITVFIYASFFFGLVFFKLQGFCAKILVCYIYIASIARPLTLLFPLPSIVVFSNCLYQLLAGHLSTANSAKILVCHIAYCTSCHIAVSITFNCCLSLLISAFS